MGRTFIFIKQSGRWKIEVLEHSLELLYAIVYMKGKKSREVSIKKVMKGFDKFRNMRKLWRIENSYPCIEIFLTKKYI